MHDHNNTFIEKGDIVIFRARVIDLQKGENYCNVSIESIYGRRPDGEKETIHSINTGTLILERKGEQ